MLTLKPGRSFRGPSLFVRGYNDVEAIDADEIETKRNYIRSNIERRVKRCENAPLFRIHRDMQSRNWTPERVMQGLLHDLRIADEREKQVTAWQALTIPGAHTERDKVCHKLKAGCGLDMVGNMELLKQRLVPLICHRADTMRFEEQKTAVLKAAREECMVMNEVVRVISKEEDDWWETRHAASV